MLPVKSAARRTLFLLSHKVAAPDFNCLMKRLAEDSTLRYSCLLKNQENDLQTAIDYAFRNIPYYRELFKSLDMTPADIKRVQDLRLIPILEKETIRSRWNDFLPRRTDRHQYYDRATGGSTGTPLKYRMSKEDRYLAAAIQYRGWGYAGYTPGHRVVFLAGGSLGVGNRLGYVVRTQDLMRNIRRLSSFNMGERQMRNYAEVMNRTRPRFIRGYPSALLHFSKWARENDISLHLPTAILTTAEKLFPHIRKELENTFGCEVYDGYGLNDGGVSAYECSAHEGMHIDTERAVLEVVGDDGETVESGEGRIIATSLHNSAMPFIRYDTGDIGHVVSDRCSCGRGHRLLTKVVGREQELLRTPEGMYIHGEFFSHVMWEEDLAANVREFQIIQDSIDHITVRIVSSPPLSRNQSEYILESVKSRSKNWKVDLEIVDRIERPPSGKYRFVVRKDEL